jgi:hypothetical protein
LAFAAAERPDGFSQDGPEPMLRIISFMFYINFISCQYHLIQEDVIMNKSVALRLTPGAVPRRRVTAAATSPQLGRPLRDPDVVPERRVRNWANAYAMEGREFCSVRGGDRGAARWAKDSGRERC